MADDPRRYVQVHADLGKKISAGDYRPGQRLHIGRLADAYSVSRPTIARALQLLADEGKARRYPGIGWIVE